MAVAHQNGTKMAPWQMEPKTKTWRNPGFLVLSHTQMSNHAGFQVSGFRVVSPEGSEGLV